MKFLYLYSDTALCNVNVNDIAELNIQKNKCYHTIEINSYNMKKEANQKEFVHIFKAHRVNPAGDMVYKHYASYSLS